MKQIPKGPWKAGKAAVYAADGRLVCSLDSKDVKAAYRKRGDREGAMIRATCEAIALLPEMHHTLQKNDAVLGQLQDNPAQAVEIIAQGYFASALVGTSAVLAKLNKLLPLIPAGAWDDPSAGIYAADGKMVCTLGEVAVVTAYRERGDDNGVLLRHTCHAIGSLPSSVLALQCAEKVLQALQGQPKQAGAVIAHESFTGARELTNILLK